ncbi:hypothetical protein [Nocardioides sp. R-C-SC26]|uniref:hypothetical protein n=1 Tax=Nocardioides sp. R-C-SC26 TaxID=2870414 RepID=UPI001E4426DC|nr:hypothetical protein [Nocardioides sp. R-C-SC26]
MTATLLDSPAAPASRAVAVSGVRIGAVFVDDAVLDHCHRSAEGGFDFRVRRPEVAEALVAAGLAVRGRGERTVRGTGSVARRQSPTSTAATTDRAPQTRLEPERSLGRCVSDHHLAPVDAVTRGRRARGADPAAGHDEVSLCGRCADLLARSGYFTAIQ